MCAIAQAWRGSGANTDGTHVGGRRLQYNYGDVPVSDIRFRSDQGILEITLCRVSKRNALTAAMYGELADLIESASTSDDVRVILFVADGSDFCAGNDLLEFLGEYDLARGTPWRRFIDALSSIEKPMVAAVHGNAVGIGMTMLLHFDVVYVEPTARLSAPFAKLGLVPEAGSSQLLSDLIGPLRAGETFLLGRSFGAEESVQLGMANALVPVGAGKQTALQAATAIARLPVRAVNAIMRLKRSKHATLADRIDAECSAFMDCIRSSESQEIVRKLTSSSLRRNTASPQDQTT